MAYIIKYRVINLMLTTKKVQHTKIFCHRNWQWLPVCFQRLISSQPRFNSVNIQMLSESLHQQIFKNATESKLNEEALKVIQKHLHKHGLSDKTTTSIPDVDLKLPPLHGNNINEHFIHIANKQIADYKLLIDEIISKPLPKMPDLWQKASGWTKYCDDGSFESVPFPDDRGLVFDIECLMSEGNYPTMATAVSARHW